MPADTTRPLIAHMVYFTLKDPSPAAQQKLVDDCHRYLKVAPGIVYFAAGMRVADLTRPVNVTDFHVGLHVVFESRKAHDDYQVDERHLRFIAENKESWSQVRVFDCNAS
ncbi:MAG TPA: Dabb family protein [Planctomycetaceae bacterium]|nr:Dabb family protein [Planctomycetaceae bacterium]